MVGELVEPEIMVKHDMAKVKADEAVVTVRMDLAESLFCKLRTLMS